MKSKVALLVFNPFKNDSRVYKEANSLAKYGYIVEVVGHLDRDTEAFQQMEEFVVRRFAYLDRTVTKSKVKKLWAYFHYLLKSALYCKSFDILHCNDLNTLPVAWIIKKLFRKKIKIVYDAHEYETETNGLRRLQRLFVKKLESILIYKTDAVITVSESIATEYTKLYAIAKPYVVLNTPLVKKVNKSNLLKKSLSIEEDSRIFLYQGALSPGRGIELIVETFIHQDEPNDVIVFMGYGPLEGYIRTLAHQHKNIYYHDAVDPMVLLDYTASADFGICLIEDTCLSYRYALPNKMFEYMMAEIPIVVSNLPEMKKIVNENGIGTIVQEHNSSYLAKAIEDIKKVPMDELIENLRNSKKVYNWQTQEKVLYQVYDGLYV